MKRILTHPGSAHKDDFLACCLLVAKHGLPVVREEPGPRDLEDPSVLVVDVGGVHDPERGNFDHHQFPADHEPVCSLSLVLRHLGLYEDARAFCEWLEPTEWFDSRGPFATADWLGIDRAVVGRLNSPVDITLLRRFAQRRELGPGDPVWEVMRMVGEDLFSYLRSLRERLDFLGEHARFLEVGGGGRTIGILYLPRTDPMPDDPSSGLARFIEQSGRRVDGLVYPDRRGAGFGLSRHEDSGRLDFTRIAGEPDVHFAHARGFVAKTSATDLTRLLQLVEKAMAS